MQKLPRKPKEPARHKRGTASTTENVAIVAPINNPTGTSPTGSFRRPAVESGLTTDKLRRSFRARRGKVLIVEGVQVHVLAGDRRLKPDFLPALIASKIQYGDMRP